MWINRVGVCWLIGLLLYWTILELVGWMDFLGTGDCWSRLVATMKAVGVELLVVTVRNVGIHSADRYN